MKLFAFLLDVFGKLNKERKNDKRSSQEQDWAYPKQQTAENVHNFMYPNEYNPTPPKFEHHFPDIHKSVLNQHNPVPTFKYPNEYNPTPPNIVGNIPDVNLYKPDSNKLNHVPTFQLPHQYNPSPPSIPDLPLYKPDPNQNHPVLNFKYPNEYNPTQQTPKIPKTGIWRSRTRYRPRQGRRQRRPYRSRRPLPTLRPRPCKPSIWGNYYGYYGT